MRKGIFAAVLIPLFMLVGATGAQADIATRGVTVPPGEVKCTTAILGNYGVRATGQVSYGSPGVLFLLKQSSNGYTFGPINQSPDNTVYWVAQYDVSAPPSPKTFPGFFKACARNNGASYVTVNLTVATDSNV